MDKKYVPISCSFYDFIEHFATLKKEVLIRFINAEGQAAQVKSRIVTTKNNKDGEFILLEKEAQLIRLDQLIAIEDKELKDYTTC